MVARDGDVRDGADLPQGLGLDFVDEGDLLVGGRQFDREGGAGVTHAPHVGEEALREASFAQLEEVVGELEEETFQKCGGEGGETVECLRDGAVRNDHDVVAFLKEGPGVVDDLRGEQRLAPAAEIEHAETAKALPGQGPTDGVRRIAEGGQSLVEEAAVRDVAIPAAEVAGLDGDMDVYEAFDPIHGKTP